MLRLLLTLDSPAGNLALDEALLDEAETAGPEREFLRLWESPRPLVVIGRSSHLDQEVNADYCRSHDVPVLRRSSGGAAIVAGSGCLMYALVLSHDLRPELRGVPETHRYVLGRIAGALQQLVPTVQQAGTSDLAFVLDRLPGNANPQSASLKKFSGNSLRVKRTHSLYHGTLLYDFDLKLLAACLGMPSRQPDYREARSHTEFVSNLPIGKRDLESAVLTAWPTTGDVFDWPRQRVEQLVAERYGHDDWHL